MTERTSITDEQLTQMLRTDSDQAIDLIFRKYYGMCRAAALRIVKDVHLAEDLTQDVFLELWRKRADRQINTALKAYLRRSVVNRCLNYIRDRKMAFDEDPNLPEWPDTQTDALSKMETSELEKKLMGAIDALPERCRIVFNLSRFEEMSYQQIATELEISVKTVENQISKALRLLRKAVDR